MNNCRPRLSSTPARAAAVVQLPRERQTPLQQRSAGCVIAQLFGDQRRPVHCADQGRARCGLLQQWQDRREPVARA